MKTRKTYPNGPSCLSLDSSDNIAVVENINGIRDNGVDFTPNCADEAIPGTTYFGRNKDIHDQLIDYFTHLKSQPVKPVDGHHVFFPASSVGCEPYYFAMRAKEAGLFDDNRLHIHASDLRSEFLRYAARGSFSSNTLKHMDTGLKKYFQMATDGRYHLSNDIVENVTFEPPGDVRDHENSTLYDAVVMPHVLYHYHSSKDQEELLQSLMSMSRGIVVTDDTSFVENPYAFEQTMLSKGFGYANKNWDAHPLKVVRNLNIAEKLIPFVNREAVTNFEANARRGSFLTMRLPSTDERDFTLPLPVYNTDSLHRDL